MKGKNAKEKKQLLKEIENARQAKIHMTFLLEQQKLRADEKWAVRNVEERAEILNLYKTGNSEQRADERFNAPSAPQRVPS